MSGRLRGGMMYDSRAAICICFLFLLGCSKQPSTDSGSTRQLNDEAVADSQGTRPQNDADVAVEQADAFWTSKFRRCGEGDDYTAWRGGGIVQLKQRAVEVTPIPITPVDKLNGLEYQAVTSVTATANRINFGSGWRDWTEGPSINPVAGVSEYSARIVKRKRQVGT